MATIDSRIDSRARRIGRGVQQIDKPSMLANWVEGYSEFRQELVSFSRTHFFERSQNTTLTANNDIYAVPVNQSFSSIIIIELAYKYKADGTTPDYHPATQLSELEFQKGSEILSHTQQDIPRYRFISKGQIQIFPTPKINITSGMKITYNTSYMSETLNLNTDDSTLNIPQEFMYVIDARLTYKLYTVEDLNKAPFFYQQFREMARKAMAFLANLDETSNKQNRVLPNPQNQASYANLYDYYQY